MNNKMSMLLASGILSVGLVVAAIALQPKYEIVVLDDETIVRMNAETGKVCKIMWIEEKRFDHTCDSDPFEARRVHSTTASPVERENLSQ